MYRNQFESPIQDPEQQEEKDEKEYLESLPPDIMEEKAMTLLGTVDACLDNLENLKYVVSIGESAPKDQRKQRVKFRDIINDHVSQVKIMLETDKIKLDDCLTFLGEEKQQRLKDLFDRSVIDFMVANSLN